MKPSEIECTNLSKVVIECILKEQNISSWKSTWTHKYNGQLIRNPGSSVNRFISTMTIDACSFHDRGIYTCSWHSDFARHNSSAIVEVLCKY